MKRLKAFFETPKQNAVFIGCIAAALVLFGAGMAIAAGALAKRYASGADRKAAGHTETVSLEEAIAAALSDAGAESQDVTVTKAERELEDGIVVFDIEFSDENTKYEYGICEDNGKVYSKSKETVIGPKAGSTAPAEGPEDGTGQAAANEGEDIGLEHAKEIALGHAGCTAGEVQFSKAKYEKEHGNAFYEIKFYKDGIEYEYTIHAASGEILEFETEADD